jgi:hypothetical protein
VSPEEDGVDEAGRTARQPLITAPPGLETDPDTEAPATAPLPAETVGRTKNGSARTTVARATDKASEQPAEPEAEAEDTLAGQNGRKPSFTPSKAAPAEDKPAVPAPALASEAEPAPKPETSAPSAWGTSGTSEYTYPDPYQASGSSYTGSSYTDSPATGTVYESPATSYLRGDWSPGQDEPTAYSAPVADTSAAVNGSAAPGQTKEAAAPAGESSTGGFSAVSNFSSAAATAVTGTAAGLLGSVSGAWRNRGANRKPDQPRAQVRRPAKRQAMLTLARVEPWSVMKFSFVASVVAFIILFVAVAVLYMVLSALGVFDSIQSTVNTITSSKNTAGTNISHWFSASLILGYTAMLGALNIVLITAISTVGSVIYNLIAKTIGGIEVTLRETD